MNTPDFSLMTDEQLRAYVLANRQEQTAFRALIDRMQQHPPVAVIEPEEWSESRMQQALDEKKRHVDQTG